MSGAGGLDLGHAGNETRWTGRIVIYSHGGQA